MQAIGFVCVFVNLAPSVLSQVRMVCPKSRSPRTSEFRQEEGSQAGRHCSIDTFIDFHQQFTDLTPGPYTIRFEETVYHKDSPFRITLHQHGNNLSSCLLLDHVPHNNEASIVSPDCKADDYPVGKCSGSTYYITVKIPDIECKHCYLQVTLIDTDKQTGLPCNLDDEACKAYCSIANVRIWPSERGQERTLDSCTNYVDNLYGNWPYAPKDIYEADVETVGKVRIIHDTVGHKLEFLAFAGSLSSLESFGIYRERNATADVQDELLTVPAFVDKNRKQLSISYTWSNVTQIYLEELREGDLSLIVTTDDKSYRGGINFVETLFEEGVYNPHTASYSPQGWLSGSEFVGFGALYPAAVLPSGSCSPKAHYYTSTLHSIPGSRADKKSHGILGLIFIENRVTMTAVFHTLSSNIETIVFEAPALGGCPNLLLQVPDSISESISVTVDATKYKPFLGTLKFLKRAKITTKSSPDGELGGDLEEGMMSVIRDQNLEIWGQTAFQFTQDGGLLYAAFIRNHEIVLNLTINKITYNRRGNEVLCVFSKFLIREQDLTFYGEGILSDLSSEFLMHLWMGNLYIRAQINNMISDTSQISGLISPPGSWYCKNEEFRYCPVTPLMLRQDQNGTDLQKGLAAFVLDRANVFHYSLQLQSLASTEDVKSVVISKDDKDLLTIGGTARSATVEDGFYETHGYVPGHSPELLGYLTRGLLKIKIHTTNFPRGEIQGDIPLLHRTICSKPKTFEVGGERGWSVSASLKNFSVITGDSLIFTYNGNETVWLLTSRESFQHCDFRWARIIGHYQMSKDSSISHLFKDVKTFYIASEATCNHSPALKFILTVVDKVPEGQKNPAQCNMSLFHVWKQWEVDSYRGTNVVGAAVGGTVAGLLVLVSIVLWDRHLNTQSSASNGFERF